MKKIKHKKLEWCNPSSYRMDWENANNYCESICKGWRLPTIKELKSVISYDRKYPALKKKFIKEFDSIESDFYWSSTSLAGNDDYAWHMKASYGTTSYSNKSIKLYVWPIREIKS